MREDSGLSWVAIGLIIVGAIFSLFNWSSLVASTKDRFVSPVPFAGALPLTIGLLLLPETRPWWWIAALADYGTLILLLSLPWLAREFWSTSRFQLIEEFRSQEENRSVRLKLFRRAIAVISIEFDPPEPHGDGALVQSIGLQGKWRSVESGYRISEYGEERELIIRPSGDAELESSEIHDSKVPKIYSLDRLSFRRSK